MTELEFAVATIGAYVIQYGNAMGLPKSIIDYVAARTAVLFIWSMLIPT
jgi:hypothetical protein